MMMLLKKTILMVVKEVMLMVMKSDEGSRKKRLWLQEGELGKHRRHS